MSGWLFKRGGLRKNWLRRWFVLARTGTLLFLAYFDHSEVANKSSIPKGVIPLTGARVSAQEAAEQRTAHKHSLVIHTAGRDYSIYAESAEAAEQWARSLERALTEWRASHPELELHESAHESYFQQFQGKSGSHKLWLQYLSRSLQRSQDSSSGQRDASDGLVFGGSIISLVRRASRISSSSHPSAVETTAGPSPGSFKLPPVLEQCFAVLRKTALNQVGIFRLSANRATVDELAEKFNRKDAVGLADYDPHVCACLLKLFFRELKDPLMTFQLYPQWVLSQQQQKAHASRPQKLAALRRLLELLPPEHLFVLFELCTLLLEFDAHSHLSNMNTSNLSIVFTPNLFRLPDMDMLRDIKDAPFLLGITKSFLDHFALLFQPQIKHSLHLNPHPLESSSPMLSSSPISSPSLVSLRLASSSSSTIADDSPPLAADSSTPPLYFFQPSSRVVRAADPPAPLHADPLLQSFSDLLDHVETELLIASTADIMQPLPLYGPFPTPDSHAMLGNLFDDPSFFSNGLDIDLGPTPLDEDLVELLITIISNSS